MNASWIPYDCPDDAAGVHATLPRQRALSYHEVGVAGTLSMLGKIYDAHQHANAFGGIGMMRIYIRWWLRHCLEYQARKPPR